MYHIEEGSGTCIHSIKMTENDRKCRKQTPTNLGGKLVIPTSGSHIWSYKKQNEAHEGSMESWKSE